ncbi:MAG: hypothetical protein IKU07_07495 [Oscillospiraceae bacterium]|nr:hypothetical protein [Oscillospiraceae bacterium]
MIDRKKVKEYFNGKSQLGPLVLMLVGFLTLAFVVGIFLLIGGLVWFLVNKFGADLSGEAEVDAAKQYEIKQAEARAMAKLNVIDEQVQNVEPVVVSGRGFQPGYVEGMIMRNSSMASVFKNLFEKKQKKDEYDDPIYLARIGSDGKYRSSLISTSVFMFGEKQLFVYFSNVDLTTGIVYSEGVHEFFYADINGLTFLQNKEKVFNYKKKRYEGILFESVKLFSSGCSYTATLSTDLDKSIIDKEFAGMRTLIRERKG